MANIQRDVSCVKVTIETVCIRCFTWGFPEQIKAPEKDSGSNTGKCVLAKCTWEQNALSHTSARLRGIRVQETKLIM